MTRRPVQDVRVWQIQDRRSNPSAKSPYIVRWVVDGMEHNKSFRVRVQADRYRSRLLVAVHDGEWFDRRVGEPESWRPAADATQVYVWARRWVLDGATCGRRCGRTPWPMVMTSRRGGWRSGACRWGS